MAKPSIRLSNKLVSFAALFTLFVTLSSLRELQLLVRQADLAHGGQSQQAGHADWKGVAARAVAHVEHLPQLPHKHKTAHVQVLDRAAVPSTPSRDDDPPSGGRIVPAGRVFNTATNTATNTDKIIVADDEDDDKQPIAASCNVMPHTELWGDVVKWGSDFRVTTAAACCDACQKFKPAREEDFACNGIVGPDGESEDTSAAAAAAAVAATGPLRKYHVVTTAQGSAVHWQARVHYYWYKKQKAVCEQQARCEMGGFTRLLHSGLADDLMDEIPTFVAQPLPNEVVEHNAYPVLNRPYAFVQWLEKANIQEEYILMSEPDHIFLQPIPNLMHGNHPAAFPFFYIEPTKPEYLPIAAKFVTGGTLTKKQAETIAPIGNSPTFLTTQQMKQVVPIWYNLSVAIYKDKEANSKWGWVQEMYAFTIALYNIGVRHVDLKLNLMAQPPFDDQMQLSPGKPYYILHYTYGCDFDATGKFTPGKFGFWRFDKRTYASMPPPRHLGDPPPGTTNAMVKRLIASINEATEHIPCWDDYHKLGHIAPCNERV
eukprot:jgi/Chrzof1/11638/Cz06g03080.t1